MCPAGLPQSPKPNTPACLAAAPSMVQIVRACWHGSAIILKFLVFSIVLQHAWPRRPQWCRLCDPGGTKTLMRHPYLNKQHAPHVPSGPSPFAETIALQHAWPRRPPWCRLCEPGGTKTLMRHLYLNNQHAPHVPSGPSPCTQPSSPPARMCFPLG